MHMLNYYCTITETLVLQQLWAWKSIIEAFIYFSFI